MRGVTVYDASELVDVLRTLEEFATGSAWKCSGIDCVGGQTEQFYEISDSGRRVSGSELIIVAAGVQQTIEGYCEAFRDGSPNPWIRIRAIEGDFDVESDDPTVLEAVHKRFRKVVPFPPDA